MDYRTLTVFEEKSLINYVLYCLSIKDKQEGDDTIILLRLRDTVISPTMVFDWISKGHILVSIEEIKRVA